MGAKSNNPDSLFTLPVAIGVIVVLGAIAALVMSGLFVYRAHAVNAQTERIKAQLEAERAREAATRDKMAEGQGSELPPTSTSTSPSQMVPDGSEPTAPTSVVTAKAALKPGIRLRAQRPAHWDQAEVIDVLEDERVKVRWLSGEPGEAVIAADLVRGEDL